MMIRETSSQQDKYFQLAGSEITDASSLFFLQYYDFAYYIPKVRPEPWRTSHSCHERVAILMVANRQIACRDEGIDHDSLSAATSTKYSRIVNVPDSGDDLCTWNLLHQASQC